MLKLLFLDIETFPAKPWNTLTTWAQQAFKNHYYSEEEDYPIEEQYNRKSGLIAEFGRIICCSVGYEDASNTFKCMALVDKQEKDILNKLDKLVYPLAKEGYGIAGWNSNSFDIPFIAKRFIINEMYLPELFNTYGTKPWERKDIDVMQIYKMGGFTNTSLEVACAAFDIPVKFADHTGKDIWTQKEDEINYNDLAMYCNNDVYSTYCIFKRLQAAGIFK